MSLDEAIQKIPCIIQKLEQLQQQLDRMEKKLETKSWLTQGEAEKYLNLSTTKLWQLRRAGQIVGTVNERPVRYLKSSLDMYLKDIVHAVDR